MPQAGQQKARETLIGCPVPEAVGGLDGHPQALGELCLQLHRLACGQGEGAKERALVIGEARAIEVEGVRGAGTRRQERERVRFEQPLGVLQTRLAHVRGRPEIGVCQHPKVAAGVDAGAHDIGCGSIGADGVAVAHSEVSQGVLLELEAQLKFRGFAGREVSHGYWAPGIRVRGT